MRPETDSKNDPTKLTNTKMYGRHKYLLLVHTIGTYTIGTYTTDSKLEHQVLLLIGWPLSSFLQLERFLIFSVGIHRNAHSAVDSHAAPLCSSKQHKFAYETR